VEVAIGVAADERSVLREGGVAFDDPRAHPRPGLVGFLRVLGELQRRAAVSDRKVGTVEGAGLALAQFVLERAGVQAVHEIERPRTELDPLTAARSVGVVTVIVVAAIDRKRQRSGRDERGEGNDADEELEPGSHDTLLLDSVTFNLGGACEDEMAGW
jgi:hypothetical protein